VAGAHGLALSWKNGPMQHCAKQQEAAFRERARAFSGPSCVCFLPKNEILREKHFCFVQHLWPCGQPSDEPSGCTAQPPTTTMSAAQRAAALASCSTTRWPHLDAFMTEATGMNVMSLTREMRSELFCFAATDAKHTVKGSSSTHGGVRKREFCRLRRYVAVWRCACWGAGSCGMRRGRW
jgi:hypothetical protein